MPKNIIVCCDGTGNVISENISNVLKLYRTLQKTGNTGEVQSVFHDPGVGTLARPDPWIKLKQDSRAGPRHGVRARRERAFFLSLFDRQLQ
jgi:uncharacterized protein (DUF2235 family)